MTPGPQALDAGRSGPIRVRAEPFADIELELSFLWTVPGLKAGAHGAPSKPRHSLAPARRASRVDLNEALKGMRRTAGADTRLRSAMAIAQLALTLTLLVGAGLLARSFARLANWEPGFDRAGLVTAWMLPAAGAFAVGRLLTSLLCGLPPADPLTLAGAVTLFTLVALAACWLPARRASRLPPASALRVE